jgi:hypothetical protein
LEVEVRLVELDARIGPVMTAVGEDPGILIDRAVAAGVAEVGDVLIDLRGCAPAEV